MDETRTYLKNLTAADELVKFKDEMQKAYVPVLTDDVMNLLHVLIRSHGVRSILEVGTAVGVSAMLFASFMGESGKVTTIERDDNYYYQAVKNIDKFGLSGQIEVLHADAMDILRTLSGPYDMIFLDGAKAHYIHMLEECIRLLKSRGLLAADNVLFRGMVTGETKLIRRKITIVKRMRIFLEEISTREELISSVLTIGDGLSLSVKK